MANALDEVKRTLRSRLEELRPLVEEYRQLEQAAAALDPPDAERGSGRASAPAARPRRGGSGQRTPRGGNKRAVFAVVAERPGVTVGELAEVTKIGRPLIYGVTRNGVERGELEAVDLGGGRKGFKLADPSAATANGNGNGDGPPAPAGKTLDEATAGIEDDDTATPVGG